MTPRRKTLLKSALCIGLCLMGGFAIACALETGDAAQLALLAPALGIVGVGIQPGKRLKALQDDKASILARMQAILDEVDKGGGKWTPDQEKDYEALEAQIEPLNKSIEREQRFLDAQRSMEPVRNRNADTPAESAARDGVGAIQDNWQKDPNCGYARPRDFLLEVIEASRPGGELSARMKFLAAAGSDEQGGHSDPHGGFFVPEGMSPRLLSVGIEADPTISRVTQIPMTSPIVKFNARVDKNHTSSVSGGLRVYRRAETQEPTASRQEFEQVKLEATGQFGLAFITEELLERSIVSFVAMLEAGFRDEFASEGLRERIRGTGVGEPLGVLKSPALISVAKENMQAADTINGTNIVNMRSRIWNYERAIWIANHDTFPKLIGAHIPGTNTDIYLFTPGNGTDVPATLFGRPIFFSEFASTVGDLGDLLLCDWSQYLWGTLGSRNPRRAESIHVRFLNHERTFKFWVENDGQPWWRSALTPKNGANTLSPFVTLAERA
jgi:HK97 family phage major capsid protein